MPAQFTHTPGVVVHDDWIALSDGVRLSARVWLPDTAEIHPVPAVLEYLPYRKDDHTAWQDSTRHPYFAAHGYAAVRVDLRGTGDSEGVYFDEYLVQEQDDALEVIEWIAAQPWCAGAVGMIGYSWGGFNGLQVAARRPPALKAVVSAYSTDDRYADDCHYVGGAVLAMDVLRWAQTMRAINALPPTPEVVGDDWRAMWIERLERTPHFGQAWLTHQTRDAYWRQGSIAEDYSAVEAATLLIGGWADAYTNAVPRMLEHLSCPRAGIIGPWAHILPERGIPGPPIGFLQECVAWFDGWLKGEPVSARAWPMLRAWIQEPAPPATFYAERPGRWAAFAEWPPPQQQMLRLVPEDAGVLVPADAAARSRGSARVRGVQACGEAGGVWCANGNSDEYAGDQRPDDARSLCFDGAPLTERLELLGRPVMTMSVAVDAPAAHVAVRLCDVAPDGTSALLTWGVLNLTHRNGDEEPEALEPGRHYTVTVELNAIGQAVEAGHRLRLAISPTLWPMVWPHPHDVTLTLDLEACHLDLPLLPGHEPGADFAPAEYAEPLERTGAAASRRRWLERDGATSSTVEHELFAATMPALGVGTREELDGRWSIDEDPTSARFECARDFALERDGWKIRIVCSAAMTADAHAFSVEERLTAYENGAEVFSAASRFDVPRRLA